MELINHGIIKVPSDWRSTLVIILNAVGITTENDDVYIEGEYAIRELEELYGDIEDELSAIVNSFGVFDVPVDVNVKYWGDYNGMYIVRNGVLVDLDENEVAIMDSSDNDLIKELESRGYTVTKENK